ncbi:hypothetical protein EPO05_03095 [Patescibacteria group bacterium]|nr:MAG: hypothetical protein EPO05_03095 [Patescibacteria group bacterium]
MSKRNLVVVAVVVVAFLLIVGFLLMGKKSLAPSVPGDASSKQTTGKESQSGSSLFTKAQEIKDAITGGQKLKCSYKITDGQGAGTESVYYVQGKKFRSSFAANGETFNSVSDGEVVYSWSSKTKQGSKMNIACMEDLAKSVPQAQSDQVNYEAPEDFVDSQNNISCESTSDIDFSVPSDVKFTDACAEMKKVFESMSKYRDQIPQDVTIPEGVLPSY